MFQGPDAFETVSHPSTVDYTHKKLSGGAGEFARIKLELSANIQEAGLEIRNKVPVGNIPKAFYPGIEVGINRACEKGLLGPYPVTDIIVSVIDGAYHDVDSSIHTFEEAAFQAFKDGLRTSGTILLEAIMRVQIFVLDSHRNAIIADLRLRDAQDIEWSTDKITALVPKRHLVDYFQFLHQRTEGKGRYEIDFVGYAPRPQSPNDPDFPPAIGRHALV